MGLAAIAAAAALWAVAAAVARRLFEAGVEPLELVQARAYVTTLGLMAIPGAWRARPPGASHAGVVGLGIAIALVNTSYYIAIDRLPVAVAIVLQYTAPALVVAFTAIVARRRPAPEILWGVGLALAGVVLVSGVLGSSVGAVDGLGLAMGLSAAVMFATYTLLSERVGAVYGVMPALLRGFGAASVAWLIFQAPQGVPDALFSDGNLPRVLFVGTAGTLVPFLLFLWGVQRVQAERAAIAATLEPVLAALVAWVWLGQTLGPVQLAGGVLVIGAVASLQVSRAKAPAHEPLLVPEP